MTPGRVQQRRGVKGWRKPPGAVSVSRPGQWGNPYDHRELPGGRAEAVELYRRFLNSRPDLVARARQHLAGKTLMCWCPPDGPCHGDVLLEIANDSGGTS